MVMGGEWPEEVWLEVRLDHDGNAMTKSDGLEQSGDGATHWKIMG